MARKVKTLTPKNSKAKGSARTSPYPSLAKAPSPAERLAQFLKGTVGNAGKAMTEDELEQWLSNFRNLWPDDAEIDEFVRWLHQARRQGRYW
jgi:hypothetical protein